MAGRVFVPFVVRHRPASHPVMPNEQWHLSLAHERAPLRTLRDHFAVRFHPNCGSGKMLVANWAAAEKIWIKTTPRPRRQVS
jgi:hypothetical protein